MNIGYMASTLLMVLHIFTYIIIITSASVSILLLFWVHTMPPRSSPNLKSDPQSYHLSKKNKLLLSQRSSDNFPPSPKQAIPISVIEQERNYYTKRELTMTRASSATRTLQLINSWTACLSYLLPTLSAWQSIEPSRNTWTLKGQYTTTPTSNLRCSYLLTIHQLLAHATPVLCHWACHTTKTSILHTRFEKTNFSIPISSRHKCCPSGLIVLATSSNKQATLIARHKWTSSAWYLSQTRYLREPRKNRTTKPLGSQQFHNNWETFSIEEANSKKRLSGINVTIHASKHSKMHMKACLCTVQPFSKGGIYTVNILLHEAIQKLLLHLRLRYHPSLQLGQYQSQNQSPHCPSQGIAIMDLFIIWLFTCYWLSPLWKYKPKTARQLIDHSDRNTLLTHVITN